MLIVEIQFFFKAVLLEVFSPVLILLRLLHVGKERLLVPESVHTV